MFKVGPEFRTFHEIHMFGSFKIDGHIDTQVSRIIYGDKHNTKLQRTDPNTKDKGLCSTRGCIFPHNTQHGFLLFPSF